MKRQQSTYARKYEVAAAEPRTRIRNADYTILPERKFLTIAFRVLFSKIIRRDPFPKWPAALVRVDTLNLSFGSCSLQGQFLCPICLIMLPTERAAGEGITAGRNLTKTQKNKTKIVLKNATVEEDPGNNIL